MHPRRIASTLAALTLASLLLMSCGDDPKSNDEAGPAETTSRSDAPATATTDPTSATSVTSAPSDTASAPTDATTLPLSTDFCANVQTMLDSVDGLFSTFEGDDYAAYVSWAQSFVPIGEAVLATAPPDQLDDITLALSPILDLAREVAPLDPSQEKEIDRIFTEVFTQSSDPEVDKAGERVLRSCGIDLDGLESSG